MRPTTVRVVASLLPLCLILPGTGLPAEADGNWLQLRRLNQSSQIELEEIQRTSPANQRQAPSPPPYTETIELNRINNQQRMEQNALQESQRRKQATQHQRNRVNISRPSDRAASRIQQQQFRQQQQHQLNSFRLQQQTRGR